MKKAHWFFVFSTLLSGLSLSAAAEEDLDSVVEDEGRVHILWQGYDRYRDIQPAAQTPATFRRQLFHELNKHFEKLAEVLPDNHLLKVTVTDIDLAGMVFPNTAPIPIRGGFINMGQTGVNIRVMEPVHTPRMDFSFELVDNNNSVLLSDTVALKDITFFDRSTTRVRHKPFIYEKRMIEQWFEDTIMPVYADSLVRSEK